MYNLTMNLAAIATILALAFIIYAWVNFRRNEQQALLVDFNKRVTQNLQEFADLIEAQIYSANYEQLHNVLKMIEQMEERFSDHECVKPLSGFLRGLLRDRKGALKLTDLRNQSQLSYN